ncbi:MAG: hypothetical protein FJY85_03745 [Deltaproteobacteria bacterium]|nr:hypothetical protein [Deltaproteobacteria bacterium]
MKNLWKVAVVVAVIALVVSLSVGDALAGRCYKCYKSYVKVYYCGRPVVVCGCVGPVVYSVPVVRMVPCPPLPCPVPLPVPFFGGWGCW